MELKVKGTADRHFTIVSEKLCTENAISFRGPYSYIVILSFIVANPPTGLTAVRESETEVTVSWIPPADGDTVTGYQIFYQDKESVIVDASVIRYTISNLEPKITYSVTMVALSAHLPSTVVGPVTPLNNFTERDLGKTLMR